MVKLEFGSGHLAETGYLSAKKPCSSIFNGSLARNCCRKNSLPELRSRLTVPVSGAFDMAQGKRYLRPSAALVWQGRKGSGLSFTELPRSHRAKGDPYVSSAVFWRPWFPFEDRLEKVSFWFRPLTSIS